MATQTLSTDRGSVVLTGELREEARAILTKAVVDARTGFEPILRHADRQSSKRKRAVYALAGVLAALDERLTLKAEEANLLGDVTVEYHFEQQGIVDMLRSDLENFPEEREETEHETALDEAKLHRYEALLAALGRQA